MFWKLFDQSPPRKFPRTASRTTSHSHRARPTVELLESRLAPAAAVGAGTGLIGNYYSDANLTNRALTRTDATLNFQPGSATLPAGTQSAVWSGTVQAQYSETYTFSTVSTGGVVVTVNGQQIINDWTAHSQKQDSGTISLTAGQTYTIAVAYTADAGTPTLELQWSSPSTTQAVVPTSQLYAVSGWLDSDIGSPGKTGSVSSTGSTYLVQGAGAAVGGTADQGHYLYQSLTGDATIIAQVGAVMNTGADAEAGVMFRDDLGAGAAFVGLELTPTGAVFQYRTTDAATVTSTAVSGVVAGDSVKLVRNGDTFAAYVSSTGADGSWTLAGTVNVTMSDTADAGLEITSGSNTSLNGATFTNVSVSQTAAVGANLDAIDDWSLDNVFVDMMKQARGFATVASLNTPATVDANGWPTEDFQVIVQSGGLNLADVYNGVYHLSFTGQATVGVSVSPATISNLLYNAATNTTTADVTLNASDSDSGWFLILEFTNTNGGVQNIRLIRPGYAANTTQIFTNQFLSTLTPFSNLRYMDWLQTNNNTIANWSDRSQVTDATQSTAKGVAWEYIIDLANETQTDLWINIPVDATDNYVDQLAALLKADLDPNLHVYVEYSNELWNGQFSQFQDNLNAAVAEVTAGMVSGTPSPLFYAGETAKNADGTWVSQYDWAWRRIAQRTEQISADFASVWGQGAMNNQIRVVLPGQFATPYITQEGLQFLQQTYGAPDEYIYGLATAPYFNLGTADNQTNLTSAQVLAALTTSMQQDVAEMPAVADLAAYYGLQDLAYEGGPDTYGANNIAAKAAASLDPAMTTLVTQFLDAWYANGGDLFNWFVAGATNYNTQYGAWGLTNSITNLNSAKYQAINQVAAEEPPAVTVGYSVPGVIAANNYVGATTTTNPYPRYLQDGNTLDYMVNAPQAGTYDLTLNYAAVSPGEQVEVIVNDQPVQTLTLAVTGPNYDSAWSPDDFANSQSVALNLNQGLNVVRLEVVNAGFTINALEFMAPAAAPVAPVAPPQPPTIAQAAAAATNPVTGTTTALSVLGADAAGESTLKYTWSLTNGPAAVAFSANGANAAKNTTATFTQAGSYTFQVTATDAAGLTATSTVTVVVNATLKSLTVTAQTATVAAGATDQFQAAGVDQFGHALVVSGATWSASSGSVSSNGLLTAPTTAGSATVTATVGSVKGQATVTVAAPVTTGGKYANGFTSSGLALNGSTQLSGTRLRLINGGTFEAGSAFATTAVNVTSFNSTFQFQLSNATADGFTFVLQGAGTTALGGSGSSMGYAGIGKSVALDFHLMYDSAGNGPTSIGLQTGGALSYGQTTSLSAALDLDQHAGDVYQVNIGYNGTTLTVTATDTATGATITQKYTVNITALVGGSSAYAGFTGGTGALTSTADILNWSWTNPPTISQAAAATPTPVTGTTTALSVLGADVAGASTLKYTWSLTSGPAAVVFSANGTNAAQKTTATFTRAGSYTFQVVATDAAGLTATSTVTVVVNATLTSLTVTPASTSVAAGATDQFQVAGVDQFGHALAVSGVTWSASTGSVSSSGLFTAPTKAGSATITATLGGVKRQVAVTVVAAKALRI